MRANKTKAKLRENRAVFGSLVSFYAPGVVELLGAIGLDFVILDGEHGGMSLTDIEHMVRAAEAFDITPLARVPNHGPDTITAFLDRGVQGVMVPHVNNKEEAQAVARAARYHPEGNRGHFASGRPAEWGVMERFDYFRRANEEVLVLAQIEELEAVENLQGILSVSGIDAIILGPGDLGQSMGWPPQDELEGVIARVVKESVAAGKWVADPGVRPGDDARAKKYLEMGCLLWHVAPQAILRRGFQGYVDWLQGMGAR